MTEMERRVVFSRGQGGDEMVRKWIWLLKGNLSGLLW